MRVKILELPRQMLGQIGRRIPFPVCAFIDISLRVAMSLIKAICIGVGGHNNRSVLAKVLVGQAVKHRDRITVAPAEETRFCKIV